MDSLTVFSYLIKSSIKWLIPIHVADSVYDVPLTCIDIISATVY